MLLQHSRRRAKLNKQKTTPAQGYGAGLWCQNTRTNQKEECRGKYNNLVVLTTNQKEGCRGKYNNLVVLTTSQKEGCKKC